MKAFLSAAGVALLLGLAGCSKPGSEQSEMGWARAALERNDRIEVVASDAHASTFTVRVKDTGELRVLRLDQVIAGPPSPVGTAAPAAADNAATSIPPPVANADTAPAPAAPADNASVASPGETATPPAAAAAPSEPRVVAADSAEGAKPPRSENASGAAPGRVLASGPGYTTKAADSKGAAARRVGAGGPAATMSVERMHEPIICQGDRFLQIDNRNLEFDGDALSAQDGCEMHITNSRILAKGVGVVARRANVHIENSDIEGESGSVAASDGAQIYSAASTFKGLRRREDTAAFHDLGGNAWN
jgi:hypothetical protein